jgi:hypothetical protein
MVRRFRRFIVILGAVLSAGTAAAFSLVPGASGADLSARGVLSASVPRLASVARRLGSVDPAARIRVVLPLRLPGTAALNRFVAGQYTPGSPDYRQFLTPAQFGTRFGAPVAEVQQVATALHRLGLNVARTPPNRLYVAAVGTVGSLERTFGVRLSRFSLPATRLRYGARTLTTNRNFYANTSNIVLPPSLRGQVTGVLGLDDSARPQPRLASSSRIPRPAALTGAAKAPVGVDGGVTPCPQANSSGGYTPPDLAQAYDYNGMYAKGFHGERMSAALVEFDDYHDSNVATVKSCYGVKTKVSRRLVNGGVGGPPSSGEGEDMADITTILGLDPKLAHLYVYEAPITGGAALLDEGTAELDLYNAFVSDDKAPVLSASWGYCEELQSASYDQLFARIAEEAAAQGQQIFDASGDSGAVDCFGAAPPTLGSLSVEQESAVPWVTSVGGTDLGHDSTVPGLMIHDEATWNDGGAGGGGQSNVWRMPAWQASYLSATHRKVPGQANDCGAPRGELCRMVPDISMNADPDLGGAANGGPTPPQFSTNKPPDVGSPGDAMYCGTSNCSLTGAPAGPGGAGGWFPIGGTSLAAPTAAAAAVLWDQEAKAAGLGSFGFLNPSLYQIASRNSAYARDYHDIRTGTNSDQYDSADCPPGCNPHHFYAAARGYDMASGLGSVDVANLGADLVKQGETISLTPSVERMYGYLHGRTTSQPVSVTSGYRHSSYQAASSASWLHVRASGKVPGTLSWYVSPKGLSARTQTGHITITGQGGSTARLAVTYTVGPRARIVVTPGTLRFAEHAINASGARTAPKCGSTTWNDELKGQLNGSSDTTGVDRSTRRALRIENGGARGSTLHYEVFFHTHTSSWLTQDLDPHHKPHRFQTTPSGPLVASAGALASGAVARFKLASIANANAAGGYPRMNQGTYRGVVEIRDLANPGVVVSVPVVLVLGNGRHTPTIATRPRSITVRLAPGQRSNVHLVLSDASRKCGYAYSLQPTKSWLSVNPHLMSGKVGARPARSAPSTSDTGQGNGFTPLRISAKHLTDGVYHASVVIQSENAAGNPRRVQVKLIVGPHTPHRSHGTHDPSHRAKRRRGFTG